jgi:signal transduction histidine kinase
MSPRPIRSGEREYLDWILRAERNAVLPLRVAMLGLTFLIWQWSHDWTLPPSQVFILFFGYTMALAFAAYCLLLNRLDRSQVRAFYLSTLVIDGIFIAGLFHLDISLSGPSSISSDYYIFFFLLVLRGYVVLQRKRDIMAMNILILLLFVGVYLAAQPTWSPFSMSPTVVKGLSVKVALIVLVMALSWFLLGTLGRERAELMAVRERLLRSENLATLGEIVAGVAHEINNPVGIISAYADFLLKKAGSHTDLADDFLVIRSEATRCQQIVHQLLSFANPHRAELQEMSLRDLNDEVLHVLFLDKKNNLIDVQADFSPDIGLVAVDPVQIKQALLNIYMNARHAMGHQGRIEVDCRPDPDARRMVRLTIHDSGPGLSEEALAHLFEPFYTSKDGGTGMGLAITRRIVEVHDGTIEATNAVEGGAVFTIRLPMSRKR